MITPSLNEVAKKMHDAARGAGWPQGIAAEIGAAAAWLSAQGANGVGIALDALRSAPSPVEAWQNGDDIWRIGPGPVALVGPSALDLALTGDGPVCMTLDDSPALFLGFAGWASTQTEQRITLDGAIAAQIDAGHLLGAPHNDPARRDILITLQPGVAQHPPGLGRQTPGATAWTEAESFAAKTRVPTTETSRTRGAGADGIDAD
jgi:hypothetical protein